MLSFLMHCFLALCFYDRILIYTYIYIHFLFSQKSEGATGSPPSSADVAGKVSGNARKINLDQALFSNKTKAIVWGMQTKVMPVGMKEKS